MLLSEGFGWYTFQPPSSAVSTTLVGHYYSGVYSYEIQEHWALAMAYGQEPTSGAMIWSALNQWALGYPDQASSHIQDALNLAQEVGHPFSLAFAQFFAAFHYCQLRSFQSALNYVEQLVELAQEQSFALWLAGADIVKGACLIQMGRTQDGLASLIHGTTAWNRMGTMIARSWQLSFLAMAHLSSGHSEEGLNALSEAFAYIAETDERYFEADLYRVKGELLLLPGGSESEAEECFNQALEVARSHTAKSLELRAGMSLARLWRKQGKIAEARELLASIYGWFTEGFDTPDLIDARALLDELA